MDRKNFEEDNFDIEINRINEEVTNDIIKKSRERNKKILNLFSVLCFLISAIITVLIYSLIMDIIHINKNNELNNEAKIYYEEIITEDIISQDVHEPYLETKSENEKVIDTHRNQDNILPDITLIQKRFNNNEIIGYLKIKDTDINYPVVLHSDNSYYLDRDFKKDKNVAGSIFMDYKNGIDMTDKNTIIYGHNMRDKSMFGQLKKYLDQDFYIEHPIIELQIMDKQYIYEVFTAFNTSTSFNYIVDTFDNTDDYKNLIEKYYSLSNIETDIEVGVDDQILTLSTCHGLSGDNRTVVAGKLIDIKE